MSVTAYVTIGNTDNKLTQNMWAGFCASLMAKIQIFATQVFIEGHSLPNSRYQNMVVGFSFEEKQINALKLSLMALAASYKQNSIALALVDGEAMMIRPVTM